MPGTASRSTAGCPTVTLPCLGGGPDVDLAALRGPLVVNLWALVVRPVPRGDADPRSSSTSETATRCAVLGIDYQDPSRRQRAGAGPGDRGDLPAARRPGRRAAAATSPSRRIRGLPICVLVDADGTVTVVARRRSTSDRASSSTWSTQHLGVEPVSAADAELPEWLRPVAAGGRVDHRRTS